MGANSAQSVSQQPQLEKRVVDPYATLSKAFVVPGVAMARTPTAVT